MDQQDIRWKQRFDNFQSAFQELAEAVAISQERELSKLEKQGVIQGFEYTHELAWNLLKDYLEAYGHAGLIGSRDSTREAFKRELIEDGETWMEMIKARNLTSHAYDRDTAERIYSEILSRFFPAFAALNAEFSRRSRQE